MFVGNAKVYAVKNVTRAVIPLCVSLAILLGCVHTPVSDPSLSGRDTTNLASGVSLALEKPAFWVKDEVLNAVLSNDTDSEIGFGSYFCLDQLVGGKWERISLVQDNVVGVWTTSGYFVPPHSQIEWAFDLRGRFSQLDAGSYRIAMEYSNSCPIPTTSDTHQLWVYAEFVLEYPSVSLVLEYSAYPIGVEIINAQWKNDTDRSIYFGQAFCLEKSVGSKWEKVDFIREDVSWLAMAYGVQPHSQRDWTFCVSCYFGSLEKGKYRIATGYGYYPLYAEFIVA